MAFARRVFLVAGIYGLIVIAPQLFLEAKTSRTFPPAITHPEFYYGFVSTALAWQVAFLLIGRDPVRYRPMMLVALIEKGVFGIAAPVLYHQGRVPAPIVVFAGMDLVLGLLFLESWRRTRPAEDVVPGEPPGWDGASERWPRQAIPGGRPMAPRRQNRGRP